MQGWVSSVTVSAAGVTPNCACRRQARSEDYLATTTLDHAILLERLRQHWEYLGVDVDRAHEMYHDDAVLEFPQSGERFEGLANFREWRRQYPADLRFRVRRMTVRENLVVVECSISYNGGPWQYGVQLLEFRGNKVARERIYVMEGWDAPEWRRPWRSDIRADASE